MENLVHVESRLGEQIAVSVCIPTFNGERHIRQTLESVLSQSLKDFEIVVSDHGSTDRTLEIVAEFREPRIRVIHVERSRTPVENWNCSVEAARGIFIKVIGQDDLLYPEALEAEVNLMKIQEPSIGFCFSHRDIVSTRGRVIARPRRLRSLAKPNLLQLSRAIVRYGANPIGEPVAVLFRKSSWQVVGQFNETGYLVDLDFYLRILERFDAIFTENCVGAFRVHPHSWGSMLKKNQWEMLKLQSRLWMRKELNISTLDYLIGLLRATIRIPLRIAVQQTVGRL